MEDVQFAADPRYRISRELLERAYRVIPTGTQTFTKSPALYPAGVSPHFVVRGRGSRVWDVDGNEYIDFVNGLATINLGYADPDVTEAVQEQLREGVIFSLPHPLETHVAEKLRELVPCAEMTRFGKNGSDATSGAIRIARAYTGRDHVIVCGYHGWQDWYIGSTPRNLGVPRVVQELTHTIPYDDVDALEQTLRQHRGQIAAVIMEPMNSVYPKPGYLEEVKARTHQHGALLIFDEMVTGFRYAAGGAQALFGVTPDLASFGKAMANGFPLAAICGRAEIMKTMESIYFSLTYAGEAMSLAAALATLNKIQSEPVVETLRTRGERLVQGVEHLIGKHSIGHILKISGHPSWTFLTFSDVNDCTQWETKTLFLQEVFARGILNIGLHVMSYAHKDADVDRLLSVYDEVFPILKQAVDAKEMGKLLRTRPLEPFFKLRS